MFCHESCLSAGTRAAGPALDIDPHLSWPCPFPLLPPLPFELALPWLPLLPCSPLLPGAVVAVVVVVLGIVVVAVVVVVAGGGQAPSVSWCRARWADTALLLTVIVTVGCFADPVWWQIVTLYWYCAALEFLANPVPP